MGKVIKARTVGDKTYAPGNHHYLKYVVLIISRRKSNHPRNNEEQPFPKAV